MPETDIEDIINNAIGDKPMSVEKSFQNAVVAQAANIIAGKRGELEQSLSATKAQEADDEEADDADDNIDDMSDDELDDLITKDDESEDE